MPMIHNRGRQIGEKTVARKILFPKAWDENGKPVREGKAIMNDTLLPGQHKMLTDEQYAFLKAQFPTELVNVDDIKDMQAQFKAAEAPKPREGYVAPDEVEARVAARVKEEMAKAMLPPPPVVAADAPKGSLAAQLETMDRGDMIAFIEKEGLEIIVKNYKQPAALKSAILTAVENKKAAASEEEAA